MLKLWENPMLSIDDRLEAASGEIERLHGLLESAAKREAAQSVEFLLGGTRLKLSFQQEECESCGASSAHFRTVPMDQYAEELQGRWVALVPAENDRHLRMLATHNLRFMVFSRCDESARLQSRSPRQPGS